MRVVYECAIFLLWTIVSGAKESESQLGPQVDEAVTAGPVLRPSSPPGQRSKRQGPGDQTTAVVGLSVQRAAGEDVYRTVKIAAARVVRERRSRRHHDPALPPPNNVPNPSKQQEPIVVHHHHHHKIYLPVQSQVTPKSRTSGPPLILTRTQQIFYLINHNARLARALKEEFSREINSTVLAGGGAGGYIDSTSIIQAVNSLIVVRENGVTCNDVCVKSQGDSLGYGTIGICTPNFCQCDFNLGTYTRYDCPSDQVFDPVSLSCKSPFDVVLCNDEDIQESGYARQTKPVYGVPTYALAGSAVTTVAPWSNAATPAPYFLANSYGPSIDSVEKQRAYGPPQSVQYGASPSQSFSTVQQQQFVTPAASPHQSLQSVKQQQQQFVTPAASPHPSLQSVQQQFVTPAASPTAEWTSWMHSKIVKDLRQLSPYEKGQLAKLVRLLANNQQILGQR